MTAGRRLREVAAHAQVRALVRAARHRREHRIEHCAADVTTDTSVVTDNISDPVYLFRGESDADDVVQAPLLASHGALGVDVPVSVIVDGPPPEAVWICATASARSVTFAANVATAVNTAADVSLTDFLMPGTVLG